MRVDMKILSHLVDGKTLYKVAHKAGTSKPPAPFGNPPTLIVMHYTAGGSGQGSADFLAQESTRASAHVVIDRDGEIYQIVPFNEAAWHAGSSSWRGKSGCNQFSIGIEIANWGPCTKRGNGEFVTWSGVPIHAEFVTGPMKHKNGGPDYYWEIYPEAQMKVVEELARALMEAYPSLVDMAGHDDIAPQAKIDPGPVFNWRRMHAITRPRDDTPPAVVKRTVIASMLNVRAGPGTQYETLSWGPLPHGTKITVLQDGGEWSKIMIGNDGVFGWVSDQYLA